MNKVTAQIAGLGVVIVIFALISMIAAGIYNSFSPERLLFAKEIAESFMPTWRAYFLMFGLSIMSFAFTLEVALRTISIQSQSDTE